MTFHDFLLNILLAVLVLAYGGLFIVAIIAFCMIRTDERKKEKPESEEFYADLDDITLIKMLDIIAREIDEGNISSCRHQAVREAAKRLDRYQKRYNEKVCE